jgi:hypothetical protein
MAAACALVGQRNMALEVHLPEQVRRFVFKAKIGALDSVDMRHQTTSVAPQDRGNGVVMGLGCPLRQ